MEHPGVHRAIKVLAGVTNYVHFFGFIPFYCPRGTTTWVVAPTRRLVTALKLLILYSQLGFMYYQTLKLWRTEDAPLMRKIHVLYTTVGFTILAFNMKVVYQDPKIIPALMNNLVSIINERWRSGMLMKRAEVGTTKHGVRISRMVKFLNTFISLTYSIAIFRKPQNPRYLTSLVDDPRKVSTPVKLIVGLYHMYATAFDFAVFMFTFAFTNTFSCLLTYTIKSLRITDVKDLADMRTKMFIITHGRSLSVLVQCFNRVFGSYHVTMEFLGIVTAVVNFTYAVTELSPRGVVIAALVVPMVLMAYGNYGLLYEAAKDSLESWMRIPRGGLFYKHCRSFRPLRVNIGAFLYANRSLTLTMLSIMLDNTANLTLTIRDS